MKPSLSDVLPLLNANCSDVLKAALLHEFFPTLPKINPMWLKAPTGEVEAAFAVLKSTQAERTKADDLLSAVTADHARLDERQPVRMTDPQVERLVRENTTAKTVSSMPAGIRFDDVSPEELSVVTKPDEQPRTEDLITAEEAATEFSYSYAGLLNRLNQAGIEGMRISGKGRTKFYSRSRVAEVCGSKGKHVR